MNDQPDDEGDIVCVSVMENSGFVTASQLLKGPSESKDETDETMHSGVAVDQPARPTKRRRIHMTPQDCLSHQNSAEGVKALSQPNLVSKSSKDPNRGLYPRLPHFPPGGAVDAAGLSGNFAPASTLMGYQEKPSVSKNAKFETAHNMTSQQRGTKSRKKFPVQSNSLHNYFSQKNVCSSQPNHGMGGSNQMAGCHGNRTAVCTPPRPISASQPCKKSPVSLMYSPIKKVSDTVYIIDDDPPSSSTQADKAGSQNCVVKTLFAAQKKDTKTTSKGKKDNGKKKPTPRFNRNNSFLYSTDKPSTGQPVTVPDAGDKYGLLGTGGGAGEEDDEESGEDYCALLPLEVLENILCQLPLMDLCLNVNRVCKYWNDIISDPKFVPWKKKYHKLKKEDADVRDNVRRLMAHNGMTAPHNYLTGLIRYMMSFKPVTARNILDCLKKHPKYSWVDDLIRERLKDCIQAGEPNPWSVITTLVILSETVADIEQITTCLLSATSQCTATEVLECLYCIATFLFAFKSIKLSDVWNGMHYRVFYALYLYENSSSSSCGQLQRAVSANKGQQSLLRYSSKDSGVRMTHEQLRICNHEIEPGQAIKIVAFAGTGKTTTLVKYTQLRPSMKFLMVVYNKFRNADKMTNNLKVQDMLDVLPSRKGENLFVRAKFVLDTINSFLASADEFVTTTHVPLQRMDDKGNMQEIDHSHRMKYAEEAQSVWNKMVDLNDHSVRITHDGYLKAYQLSKPRIYGYDVILIDEAQDLTPAIADVLLRQREAKILVGDPHQQIYSFRGAVNAMQQVTATHTFYLTQSFRFGPEIAFVAASLLEFLKGEKKKTLVGNGIAGGIHGDAAGQVAVVTRCNFTLFNEVTRKCCYSDNPIRVGFVGGTKGFGFDMILDIYTLMLSEEDRMKEKRSIKNGFIRRFNGLPELESYATKTMDNELLGKIKIVKTHNHNLPGIISKIFSKTVSELRVADIVFSTAHKAKGLEFDTVRLTDDFNVSPPGVQMFMGRPAEDTPVDECNLLYVAATRAKKRLQLSPTLYNLLAVLGERFVYPVSSKELKQKGQEFKCQETNAVFEPRALTLVQRTVKMCGGSTTKEGGMYSPDFISQSMTSLKQLYGIVSEPQGAPASDLQEIDAEARHAADLEFMDFVVPQFI